MSRKDGGKWLGDRVIVEGAGGGWNKTKCYNGLQMVYMKGGFE